MLTLPFAGVNFTALESRLTSARNVLSASASNVTGCGSPASFIVARIESDSPRFAASAATCATACAMIWAASRPGLMRNDAAPSFLGGFGVQQVVHQLDQRLAAPQGQLQRLRLILVQVAEHRDRSQSQQEAIERRAQVMHQQPRPFAAPTLVGFQHADPAQQLASAEPQLDLDHDQRRPAEQEFLVLRRPVTGLVVDHAKRSQHVPVGGRQRHAQVRPHPELRDRRAFAHQRMLGGVTNHQRLSRALDVLAQGRLERGAALAVPRLGQRAVQSLDDLVVVAQQRHQRQRRAQRPCRQRAETVKDRVVGPGSFEQTDPLDDFRRLVGVQPEDGLEVDKSPPRCRRRSRQ